ncbi:hypothetical protein BT69DRAFT_1278109 [Atractiella rhizophila]|nr:hypothetical protein BT69DRAFT_1278109 [Atractiella rhizophila]
MAEQTSRLSHGTQEPKLTALVHVITPNNDPDSIHLSILPSFLSCLPSSIQMDGAINLHVTIHPKNVSVTFLDIEGHASTVERDVKSEVDTLASYGNPFIRAFPCFRENAIFVPLASFSQHEGRFLPIDEDESSSLPFLPTASIIQLSVPPPEVIPCTISSLPVELLCLIFSFSDVAFTVSEVCELWRKVSAPYWSEPDSVSGKYTRLNRYPGAGRLWDTLEFYESMDVGMVKEIIAGSPNITTVWMHAFWNEEEAKTVLNAIEGKWLDEVSFGSGSRKWRRDEIENFMRMKGDGIRRLQAHDVEESPASASAGLHLCSRLEYLDLYKYPPLPSLCLPHTVKHLQLSNMCPLPSSISESPLPPLLQDLTLVLAPFSTDGKTSILPTPLDLSSLRHLTVLFLDGGEETSNLISREFFSTLKTATLIDCITLNYCVVDSFDFPDFIRWFFGDWRVRGIEKGDHGDGEEMGYYLEVRLFFGEWSGEEIVIARSTMAEYRRRKGSGIWEPGEGDLTSTADSSLSLSKPDDFFEYTMEPPVTDGLLEEMCPLPSSNFMRRMGDGVRCLKIYDVEDSPAAASAGFHLSSRLEYLDLYKYPPLPSLSLPRTLEHLELRDMCPLPSSISDYPLPPLLEDLTVVIAPFSANGKTSILLSPFDLSHLTHLTRLILNGGEKTPNLVSHNFFSTLKNATGIFEITLKYCVVYSFDFPQFIRWGAEERDRVDGNGIGQHLEWTRRTMGEYATRETSRWSGVWEAGE